MERLLYKYTLEHDILEFHLPHYSGHKYKIYSKSNNKLLAEISPEGVLHVYKGYSWDGCTPKWKVGDKVVGVWDGVEKYYPSYNETCQQLKYPSMIHDILCQIYYSHHGHPFYTRKDIDIIFYNEMVGHGVSVYLAEVYYLGVRGYALVKG